MMVTPTLDGGLAIEPNSEIDWGVLEMIVRDIGRPAHLAESLADLMVDDSEWEEYVMPDLAANFSNQSNFVAATIRDAREQDEQAIFIQPQQADIWYGAINQARLALEARYKLSECDDFDKVPEELRSAYFRDRFYLSMQSMLLEYVMSEN